VDFSASVRVLDLPGLPRRAFELAGSHDSSLHDAVYIALAQALGAVVVTDDTQMHAVAFKARIEAELLGVG
jgi:predicted nucleic acid-binding protein